jgi:hypothetical protein
MDRWIDRQKDRQTDRSARVFVCVWGHTLFLRVSRSSWYLPNMFHSSRGLVVHASTSPTKKLACDTEITGDVQWRTCHSFPFLALICRYGKGLSREPQNVNYTCHFTTQFLDQWLSHTAQGLSGISFPDVIELTRKTNLIDGPIKTPYDIRSFKCVHFKIHRHAHQTYKHTNTQAHTHTSTHPHDCTGSKW